MRQKLFKPSLLILIVLSLIASACTDPTKPDPDPPGTVSDPTTFNATPGVTSVELTWSGVTGATGYTLERKEGAGAFQVILDKKNQTTFVDSGLTASTTYTYRIKALKDAVSSSGKTKDVTTQSESTLLPVNLSILTPLWLSKQPTSGDPSQANTAPANVTISGTSLNFNGNGEALYYLGGVCETFTTTVSGSGTFKVFADDKEIWTGTGSTGDLSVLNKRNLSLVFQGSGAAAWTNPSLLCQSTPAAPKDEYQKGNWGDVFEWGDGKPRGTPGQPGYYPSGVIVPTHIANLPDGRIVSFSAWKELTYGYKDEDPPFLNQTASYVWNPAGTGTSSFTPTDNPSHDMFCAGLSMTADGRVFAAGGGSFSETGGPSESQYKTSYFDFRGNSGTGSWSESADGNMSVDHWYGTAVALPDNRLFVVGGSGGNDLSTSTEIRGSAESGPWTRLAPRGSGTNNVAALFPNESDVNIDSDVTLGGESVNSVEWGEVRGWYPYLNIAPNGNLFQSGPIPRFRDIAVSGNNLTVANAGDAPAGTAQMRTWGNSIMFDEGKILVTGGAVVRGAGATNTGILLDINGGGVDIQAAPNMRFRRANHNSVVLPTGEVLIIGGNNSGKQFIDDGKLAVNPSDPQNANYGWASDINTESALTPEVYSPDKNTWRDFAALTEPRNYHSTGILLQDGRVLAAGGGLCGDNMSLPCNHPNGQIFEPPYLFNPDGSRANRPTIGSLSVSNNTDGFAKIGYGQQVTVTMSGLGDGTAISKFSMIKLSAVTHSMNTDIRYLAYSLEKGNLTGSGTSYQLTTVGGVNAKNILTPGYYFLFALNDKGVPSVAKVVQVP